MSAADPETTPPAPAAIPTPVTGSGSADLLTDSTDPEVLRALLDRARERLSFYESFDRIIGENLKRTGEMMAETVALREQAAQEARKRQAADEAMQAERARYRSLLEGALSEVRNAQPVIDSMVHRLQDALQELGTPPEAAGTAQPITTPVLTPPAPAPERITPDIPEEVAPEPAPEPVVDDLPAPEEEAPASEAPSDDTDNPTAPEPPITEEPAPEPVAEGTLSNEIEILAHGVPSAATAIGLQAMLREIDVITRVDAREFADGELRLHVETNGPLTDEVFAEWLASNSGSLVSKSPRAIELSFA